MDILNAKIKRLDNLKLIIEEEEKLLSKRKESEKLLIKEIQSLCVHPPDKIIDHGGMIGSVCECSVCKTILSHSYP